MMDISTPRNGIVFITLFRLGGYQIDTCLPFSLYLRHGFRSESEQPYQNRVKVLLVPYYFRVKLLQVRIILTLQGLRGGFRDSQCFTRYDK